jgi:hypothetical protein
MLKVHPKGTRPNQVEGPLYPVHGGKKMVEFIWIEDLNARGTRPTRKPVAREKLRMPGGEAIDAPESASDVHVMGIYNSMLHKADNKDTTWKVNPKGDYWFVKFYRLLTTADKTADYQIRGRGPHPFAIAVFDNEGGGDHYVSGPLRLILDKPSDKPDNG